MRIIPEGTYLVYISVFHTTVSLWCILSNDSQHISYDFMGPATLFQSSHFVCADDSDCIWIGLLCPLSLFSLKWRKSFSLNSSFFQQMQLVQFLQPSNSPQTCLLNPALESHTGSRVWALLVLDLLVLGCFMFGPNNHTIVVWLLW